MRHAWPNAFPFSRNRTKLKGGGNWIGSAMETWLLGMDRRPTSIFPFFPIDNIYTRQRIGASPPFVAFSGGMNLEQPAKTILICSCEGTMRLDIAAIKR